MNVQHIDLPEIGDDKIADIERALFAQIAEERRGTAADRLAEAERGRARAVRRGRIWMGTTAAAAVVAVAAIIAPQLMTGGVGASTVASEPLSVPEGVRLGAASSSTADTAGGAADAAIDGTAPATSGSSTTREIIATASAAVVVDDPTAAIASITSTATAAGGYVESMSIDDRRFAAPTGAQDVPPDMTVAPYPQPAGAWISVRIPADTLTDTLAGLSELGEVTSSQVDRRDVTTESVDLRARVGALQASVDRLTELLGQSTSTADLIAAESALSQRQSELDSLKQQLSYLDDQVAMSTLTVSLTEPTPAQTANPAGFGDGLAAGWNGLVASLNGLVIGLGFLMPWLAVAAVIVLVVWLIRRARRSRSGRAIEPSATAGADSEA
ncbi:MAG: hypothetical protein ABS63_03030 [Microbacterium sp. SCN 70-27]|mgnify:CR=1 FL=1|uniref:DUF4349 domain-containing protein n=1 Tax=unclassified Microbacterium TaxID=2609290 RepID=UPI00086FA18E|nr:MULTISPECIES: DUF4349 domain-containing protein [unclassified Microbacterium]MBN9223511.1 DUF4349 domain-containing protein [Microbacterium sp.]ODT28622.1 MAG: hypothetical protein ABS63_03030 [Microbacterium sp. SCN 70-27]